MNNNEFRNIDDKWFEGVCSNLEINRETIKKGPADARNSLLSNRSGRYDLDLSCTKGASLFDLLNLFLIIDYAQATKSPVYIKLPFSGYGSYEFNEKYYTISEFNILNKGNRYQNLNAEDGIRFKRSKYVYRFLAFCNNFGFFEAVKKLRTANQLYFDKCNLDNCEIDDSFLAQLFLYSGAKSYGSKVFGLLPIYKDTDIYYFRDGSIIENWTKSLHPKIKDFPIFKDGEFARVFGYQLAMNMGEHAGEHYRGEFGALGAIAMRILPPSAKEATWLMSSFPKAMQNVFSRTENSNGVLEICVGDRGIGIVKNLKKILEGYQHRFGITKDVNDIDVISFAFDELGTTKHLETRLGGVHALHRILKCVTKYQGVMRVRTHGEELIYDPTKEEGSYRAETNFGIYTKISQEVIHPFGVQFQILIPLTAPNINKSVKLSRNVKYIPKTIEPYSIRVVPLSTYYGKHVNEDKPLQLMINLSNSLMEEPANKTIVFDFSGSNWIEDDISHMLSLLKRVIHTHKCIGVNLDSGIARLLRDREINENISECHGVIELRSFLDILSTKHRLLPVIDNKNNIWWFGLGKHLLDDIFKAIFYSDIVEINIAFERYRIDGSENLDNLMKIFLGANGDFLDFGNLTPDMWSSKIHMHDFEYALSIAIHSKFEQIIIKNECIKSKGLYKLPSTNDFSEAFFQSTPLLQDNVVSRQIGDWAAFAIRSKIMGNKTKQILLVCSTAPAELFARTIADSMSGYSCSIINLGHYSSLDKERYLANGKWDAPAIIISDVIASAKSVRHIIQKLRLNSIKIEGIVSMVMFCDINTINTYNEFCWNMIELKPDPIENVEIFFLYKMISPRVVKDDSIFNIENSNFDDHNLYLVEPFSLEIFKYQSLSQSNSHKEPKSALNNERIGLIEKLGAIRAGHWIYGSHHFLVTTCIIDMLRDDTIGGEICNEIINICINKKIDHILLPFHSQISFILPRITSALKLSASMDVDFTLCLSVKLLTEESFYILPHKLKVLIESASKSDAGLRLLIIDDAVASGRTLETILRAIVINSRKHAIEGKSPVDYVHAYSILDRQGRARGTQLTGINRFKLYGDGEWEPAKGGRYEFEFNYERWVDVDMPVKNKETCPFCSERDDLLSISKKLSSLPEEHSVLTLIRKRIQKIKPRLLDSPTFIESKESDLPWPVRIGQHRAETVELALWEFHNLLHRGCPFIYFIKWLDGFDSEKSDGINYKQNQLDNLIELKSEIIRHLFRNWERLTSQWAGYQFEQYLIKQFDTDTNIAVLILAECGATLGKETEVKKILKNLFVNGISRLLVTEKNVDHKIEVRARFALGCKLFCINYMYYCMLCKSKNGFSNEGYIDIQGEIERIDPKYGKTSYAKMEIEEIIRLSKNIYQGVDFISIFREVLIQTVRPGRHRHSHLLISKLLKIANGEYVFDNERILVRDRILNFIHSFKITLELFPRLIPLGDFPIFEEFRQNLDSFQEKLQDQFPDNLPSRSIQFLASEITNRFPFQVKNKIYQALCATQVSVKEIFSYIKSGCDEKGYKVSFLIEKGLDDIYVMCPNNTDLLDGIIMNYTFAVDIDRNFCKNPKLLIKAIKNHELDDLVMIEIYSNFSTYNKINLSTGPGKIELTNHDYSIFRVNMTDSSFDKDISGVKYHVKISIQFYKGVKVK